MRTITLSLVIAAACLAGTPALAEGVKLAWKDLDLTTAAGKTELDSRIEAAAQSLCTAKPVTGSMIAPRATASCLAEAREVIAARVNAKLDHSQMAAGRGKATADARR